LFTLTSSNKSWNLPKKQLQIEMDMRHIEKLALRIMLTMVLMMALVAIGNVSLSPIFGSSGVAQADDGDGDEDGDDDDNDDNGEDDNDDNAGECQGLILEYEEELAEGSTLADLEEAVAHFNEGFEEEGCGDGITVTVTTTGETTTIVVTSSSVFPKLITATCNAWSTYNIDDCAKGICLCGSGGIS